MNDYNYLISVDPSMKNSGFVLWEKEQFIERWNYNILIKKIIKWIPTKVASFPIKEFDEKEKGKIKDLRTITFQNKWETDYADIEFPNISKLIIEKGFSDPKMLRGALQMERVRGFIEGSLGLCGERIHIQTWRNYYLEKYPIIEFREVYKDLMERVEKIEIFKVKVKKKIDWKLISLEWANLLIKENNWEIKINNPDEAEALLIGWYWINNHE